MKAITITAALATAAVLTAGCGHATVKDAESKLRKDLDAQEVACTETATDRAYCAVTVMTRQGPVDRVYGVKIDGGDIHYQRLAGG